MHVFHCPVTSTTQAAIAIALNLDCKSRDLNNQWTVGPGTWLAAASRYRIYLPYLPNPRMSELVFSPIDDFIVTKPHDAATVYISTFPPYDSQRKAGKIEWGKQQEKKEKKRKKEKKQQQGDLDQ